MNNNRKIKFIAKSKPTLEGAGVHLNRVFGFDEIPSFDPFLLLDDFRGDKPELYRKGFPWHPHRGIETVTYMLEGRVEHEDSIGNKGSIKPGDLQWMTAGSGILHQEMPQGNPEGRMGGFQLWVNLPAKAKMIRPHYQEIKNDNVPILILSDGTVMRILCGQFRNTTGPVSGISVEPAFFDISVPAQSSIEFPTRKGWTVFAYVIEGQAAFDQEANQIAGNGEVVLFEDGDSITVTTAARGVRFLLVSGKPLHEPIAWRGPIVMNTEDELRQAYTEFRSGNFIKDNS